MEIDIQEIIRISKLAGEEILKIYEKDFEVFKKEDKSPLTLADKNANDIIITELTKKYPTIPFISEENELQDYSVRKNWDYCWLIDPLDGTKEFIKKNGEFTVNIALIHNKIPVLGVVYVPVKNTTYYAEKNKGSFKLDNNGQIQKLVKKINNSETLKIIASRSHLSKEVIEFVDDLKLKGKNIELISAGSSLKFCLVAEGKADIYPRLAPTMEWDTAAAHIVCKEAKFNIVDATFYKELSYNKENLLNPWFIVS